MSVIFSRSLAKFFESSSNLLKANIVAFADAVDRRLFALEEQRATVADVVQELKTFSVERIQETLVPAFEIVLRIQSKGFLIAESASSTETNVNDIVILVVADEDMRATFTPSPYVYLTRSSSTEDRALVRRLSYDGETGEFMGIVEMSWGDPGPHDDWIIEGAAGSGLATFAARDEAFDARDLAKDWAEKANGEDVDGVGTRSAKHHANAAGTSATAASGSATSASGFSTSASASATLAGKWATEAEDVVVSGGQYSARHWALKAAASAALAATFDPTSYFTKIASDARYYTQTQVDDLLDEKADADDIAAAIVTKASITALEAARAEAVRGEIRLAMMIADLKNTVAGFGNGLADTFDDTSGVDAAGSTGESAQSGYYTTAFIWVTEGSQSLPNMTSNSAPATHAVSADSETGGAAWQAFKGDGVTTYWSPNGKVLPKWIQRQSPVAIRVATYKLTCVVANAMPTAFTLEGSNNGSAWTTLDTQTGLSWSASEEKTFSVPGGNRGLYTYYRINVTTAGAGASMIIGEIKLLQDIQTVDAVDLRSVAFTALSAPATASLAIAAKAVGGTITANTHLKGYVSRNNGSNWTQVTLTARETLSDGSTIYEADDVDISAQPSGTQMKWRVETGSAFEVQVHAVGLYWR